MGKRNRTRRQSILAENTLRRSDAMSKILRINTRTREYRFEDLAAYAGLGGRALTSRIVAA